VSNRHTPKTKIVSMNMGGNLHDVARYCSQFGLSDFLLTAESTGYNSIILFRLPIDWPTDKHGPLKAEPEESEA
jgi:hypothetical protein